MHACLPSHWCKYYGHTVPCNSRLTCDTDHTCEVHNATILSDSVATGTVLHCMFEQEAQRQSRVRAEPSEFKILAGHIQ